MTPPGWQREIDATLVGTRQQQYTLANTLCVLMVA